MVTLLSREDSNLDQLDQRQPSYLLNDGRPTQPLPRSQDAAYQGRSPGIVLNLPDDILPNPILAVVVLPNAVDL